MSRTRRYGGARPRTVRPRGPAAWLGWFSCALALLAPACGRPEPDLPRGFFLFSEGAALRELLAGFAGLEGTPLGERSARLLPRLEGCEWVAGHAESGGLEALIERLACASAAEEPKAVASIRAERSGVFLAPAFRIRGHVASDAVALDVSLRDSEDTGALALFLPDDDAAGPSALSAEATLLHARVRPRGGLDLGRFVSEGGQGDRLFRLKSGLLSDAVLEGVWELAAYMPEAGAALPPMAAALDVRSEAVAREAIEGFVAALSEAWPIHRTPARFSAGEGACFFDLRILPDFAPCYLLRPGALVLGWNPASLERAFAGAGDGAAASRLTLHLDRLPEADGRLAGSRGPLQYAWERLEIAPGGDGGDLRIRLVPRSRSGLEVGAR